MTHLSDDDLRRWRDGDALTERDRIVSHLAECQTCAGRYAVMVRTRETDAVEGSAPEAFIDRGYRAYAPPPLRGWSASLLRPLAALAALVMIVAVAWTWRRDPTESVLRGGESRVELLRPADGAAVQPDVTFEWDAQNTSQCRLRVFDPAKPDAPIVDRRAESGTQPSGAERDRLASGISYRWFVECALAEGGSAMSASRRFRIR
jgi:hypothetical protein